MKLNSVLPTEILLASTLVLASTASAAQKFILISLDGATPRL